MKNLVAHDGGKTFRVIRQTLEEELGYRIRYKVINGMRWTPQNRERIYIVGFRDHSVEFEFPDESVWPEPGRVKVGSILQPHDQVDPKYTLTDKLWEYLQGYREKHSKAGNGFGCSVVRPEDTTRTLSARYHKDGSEILVWQGDNKNPRRLTPYECALLMGFAPSFKLVVSDTQLYHQFGNSVVVPAVKAVAEAMSPYLKQACKGGRRGATHASAHLADVPKAVPRVTTRSPKEKAAI